MENIDEYVQTLFVRGNLFCFVLLDKHQFATKFAPPDATICVREHHTPITHQSAFIQVLNQLAKINTTAMWKLKGIIFSWTGGKPGYSAKLYPQFILAA